MSAHAHHDHGSCHRSADFSRSFALGIALNMGFVAVEAFYGWRVGSLALLADAGHNLSDVAGLILAWAAALASDRLPDHRHTYGWQRASILAAFANAVLLLVAMGSLLWEAAGRLQSPAPTDGYTIIVIAALGVLVNGATAALFMAGGKSDMNIRGAFLHMAADAFVSLGVVGSGALYMWTGWAWLDPATSMVIAGVIIVGTWGLFRQSLHLLFDGVPESVVLVEVDVLLRAMPGVEDVHDLHVWAISTTDIALTAHLVMPGGHPGDTFLELVGHELREHFHITHPTIQIELHGLDHGCPQPLT
jgi:cobalt-zinc-cadmium efflux system protein